jgi:hypothetical protein
MRKAVILAGVLALSACAYPGPNPQLVAQLEALKGKPEAELIRNLGVPTRTYDSSGHRFLAFDRTRYESIPGGPGPGFGYWGGWRYGGWGGWGAFPAEIVKRDCEITFDLAGGVVQTWQLRGNDC